MDPRRETPTPAYGFVVGNEACVCRDESPRITERRGYTARRVGESVYGFKVPIEEGTDRILGRTSWVPTWTR